MTTERFQRYGNKVVPGDLIILRKKDPCSDYDAEYENHDSNIQIYEDNTSTTNCETTVSIEDVVLPLFGSDVIYPTNEIGRLYHEFLKTDGTPGFMDLPSLSLSTQEATTGTNHHHSTTSQTTTTTKRQMLIQQQPKGSYRRIVCKPLPNSRVQYKRFTDDDNDDTNTTNDYVFTFQLPKGAYATMLLRELMYTTVVRD